MNCSAERYQQNLNVLSQLKSGKCNQDLLKSYTGWGGLRDAIYTPQIYCQLKSVLTPDEIISLKKTLSNAYYTPKEMVTFIYDFLSLQGFQGGDILEPAVGNGVFIEHMPRALRENSSITAVEIDQVTSQICKNLYPDVQLHTVGFETFNPTQKYDLIIGNPPYGAQTLKDAQHQDLNGYCIHHYFVAKSMRLLKQGGILAMVLPAYFLDNESKHVRHIIAAEGGELVAAYRLPDNLFSDAKVTVDIVFLRKGKTNNAPAWTRTQKIKVSGYALSLNEYYHQHKSHVIGKFAVVDMYNRKGLTCKKTDDNTFEQLKKIIQITPKPKSENIQLVELRTQFNALCEELKVLKQALIATARTMTAVNEKITALEVTVN